MRTLPVICCILALLSSHPRAQSLSGLGEGPTPACEHGWALASTGDLDNDAIGDLAVGRPGAALDTGAVQLVSLPGGGPIRLHQGEAPAHRFGEAVGGGRDVDGDGVPDLVVGAPAWDLTHAFDNRGKVYVYSGSSGNLIHQVAGTATLERLGTSVALLPDLDGDGRAEFAAGAPGAGGNTGAVRVWSGLNGAVMADIPGNGAGAQFGTSIAPIGDVNADGIPDLVAGAPTHPQSSTAGQVSVIAGSTWSTIRTLAGLQAGEAFGWSVASAGDIDGDQIDDVVVGAPDYDTAAVDAGRARTYSGADGTFLWEVTGPHVFMKAGLDVDGVADLDGDGGRDVLVGMPYIPP